jgi:hypothetical protein
LVNFIAIWSILWQFGPFSGHILWPFGMLCLEKSGNPSPDWHQWPLPKQIGSELLKYQSYLNPNNRLSMNNTCRQSWSAHVQLLWYLSSTNV